MGKDVDYGSNHGYDPTWTGYVTDRKVKDLFVMLIFLAYFGGMVVLGIVAYKGGNPSLLDKLDDQGVANVLDKAARALKDDKMVLLGTSLAAVVLAFTWLQVLRYFTKPIIYVTLVCGVVGVVIGGIAMINISIKENLFYLKLAGIIVLCCALLLVGLIWVLRKKINFTAVMIEEACRGISNNLTLLTVVSPVMLILFGLFVAFWLSAVVYLFSYEGTAGTTPPPPPTSLTAAEASTPSVRYVLSSDGTTQTINDNMRWLVLYFLFGGFWTVGLLSAVIQSTFGGAIAQWYFSRGGLSVVGNPSLIAFRNSWTYSLGSLAFGSMVLAFLSLVNWILKQAQRETQNPVLKFFLCCLRCICGCIEGIIAYLTTYAYIYVAMYGHSFIEAAKETFNLMGRSGLERVLADTITHWVLILGNVACTGLMVALGVWINNTHPAGINGWSIVVTAVVTATIFYFLSLAIRVGADTVFICYLEDLERNSASKDYLSPDLHNSIQERAGTVKSAPTV